MKRIVLLSTLTLGLTISAPATAVITISIDEVGANVVTSFNGTFDLTGMTNVSLNTNSAPRVRGTPGFYSGVTAPPGFLSGYSGLAGPNVWGSGTSLISADSAFGDLFALEASAPGIFFDQNFTSGGSVSGGSTFNGATLASLGLTPGTYVYTSQNDSVVVNIGQGSNAVPEPGTWAMMLLGFGAMGWSLKRRRKLAFA